MKNIPRFIALIALLAIFINAFHSCAPGNMTTDIDGKRVRKSLDPVSRKSEPLPKNFILKEKKRPVLGQEK